MPRKQAIKTSLPKVDGRTKNGSKLDIAKVIKLRQVNNLSFDQIADQLHFTKQYIHTAYNKFKDIIQPSEITDTFSHARVNILSGIELSLLQDLADKDKRKKASLNNVAYAFNQVHTARRLEEGKSTAGGVSVTIELAYQEASKAAKDIRLRHAGRSSTTDIVNNDGVG